MLSLLLTLLGKRKLWSDIIKKSSPWKNAQFAKLRLMSFFKVLSASELTAVNVALNATCGVRVHNSYLTKPFQVARALLLSAAEHSL